MNNRVLLITFALTLSIRNKERLVRRIKEYGSWARLTETSYLISTHHTPENVRNYLLEALFEGDTLYVTIANAPSAWYGLSDEVSKWIHGNQT